MDTKPHEISIAEWKEIIALPIVRESWGLSDETPEEFAQTVYGVKFDFMSGHPGYVGDLFILQGDGLECPLILRRSKETGQLFARRC